jgi:O-acetyl-ADP-ribose deacetylase (regulator of RNase III)
MEYVLIDIDIKMIEGWKVYFANEPNVKIVHGSLVKVECDAIVSPANSFGFMDGGVDYVISERLGWDLQDKLQAIIKALPEGELLVGKALTVETGDVKVPYLISAPTMRIPTNFNIPTSVNAYLAMKATLIEARKHDKIQTVAIPGFCTGCGKMNHEIAARQMYQAFLEIEKGQAMNFDSFGSAQKYQLHINPKGMIWD